MRTSAVMTMTAAIVLAVATLATTPAAAGKKKSDLQKDGYTCVRVSVNFIECTKDGATTYWCDDAGNCEAKPKKQSIPNDAIAPKGGVLEVDPGSSGGKKGPAGMEAVQPKTRN